MPPRRTQKEEIRLTHIKGKVPSRLNQQGGWGVRSRERSLRSPMIQPGRSWWEMPSEWGGTQRGKGVPDSVAGLQSQEVQGPENYTEHPPPVPPPSHGWATSKAGGLLGPWGPSCFPGRHWAPKRSWRSPPACREPGNLARGLRPRGPWVDWELWGEMWPEGPLQTLQLCECLSWWVRPNPQHLPPMNTHVLTHAHMYLSTQALTRKHTHIHTHVYKLRHIGTHGEGAQKRDLLPPNKGKGAKHRHHHVWSLNSNSGENVKSSSDKTQSSPQPPLLLWVHLPCVHDCVSWMGRKGWSRKCGQGQSGEVRPPEPEAWRKAVCGNTAVFKAFFASVHTHEQAVKFGGGGGISDKELSSVEVCTKYYMRHNVTKKLFVEFPCGTVG